MKHTSLFLHKFINLKDNDYFVKLLLNKFNIYICAILSPIDALFYVFKDVDIYGIALIYSENADKFSIEIF